MSSVCNSDNSAPSAVKLKQLLVAINDATVVAQMSRRELGRRASKGEIELVRRGSRVFVTAESLEKFVAGLPRVLPG